MPEIAVTISGEEVTIDFSGFPGISCLEKARALCDALRLLGIETDEGRVTPKPELVDAFTEQGLTLEQQFQVGELE